jgi:hypothetical protein
MQFSRGAIRLPLVAAIVTLIALAPASAQRMVGENTDWIIGADDPAAPLARGEGGKVGAEDEVRADAGDRGCRAIRTNARAELTEMTCGLIEQRARYPVAPGLEAREIDRANHVAGDWYARARSVEVNPAPLVGAPFHPTSSRVSEYGCSQMVARGGEADVTAFAMIGSNGWLVDCIIRGSSGKVELDPHKCALLVRSSRSRMPEKSDGRVYEPLSILTVY